MLGHVIRNQGNELLNIYAIISIAGGAFAHRGCFQLLVDFLHELYCSDQNSPSASERHEDGCKK